MFCVPNCSAFRLQKQNARKVWVLAYTLWWCNICSSFLFLYTRIQRRRGLGPSHRKLGTRRNKRQVISLLARYILYILGSVFCHTLFHWHISVLVGAQRPKSTKQPPTETVRLDVTPFFPFDLDELMRGNSSCDTTIKDIPKPSPKERIQVQMPIMVCKWCAAYAVCQSCHAKDGSESNQEIKARGQGEELLKGPTRQQRKRAAPTSSNSISRFQESCNHSDKSTFREEYDEIYWRLKWRSSSRRKNHVNLYCGKCKCDFSW